VDVIAFSPIVEDGWDSVLLEAKEAGIPVIVADRTVNVEDESLYATHIGSNFYDEGVRAGEYLLKKLSTLGPDATLRVVELAGTTDSSPMLGRAAGFRDTIEGEERLSILDSVDGDFLIAKGMECMRDLLREYDGDINVVYSHNDAMMYGALDAFGEYGVTPGKDVIVISVDGEQEAIDLLKEGKVNCVVECTPMLGEAIMQIAKDLVDGKPVEREIYSSERAFTEFDDLSQLAPRGY
jgi:simple sugar transport system substrate-binding protein